MAIIECRDVGKTFDSKGAATVALQGVSMVFPSRGLIVIYGSSGSGKSTLLNLLAGMDSPNTGSVFFDQEKLSTFSSARLSRLRREKIGRMFQHYELIEGLDVLTNASLSLQIQGEEKIVAEKRAEELLGEYGLSDCLHKKVDVLSGGEKQRVAFIRSIIHNPEILLADEPTGALDFQNATLVRDMLRQYAQKALVVVVTHDLNLFKSYADGWIQLSDGRVISITLPPEDSSPPISRKLRSVSHRSPTWPSLFASLHVKKRKKINALGIVAAGIAWASCLVTVGFAFGSPKAIAQASQRYFDYGTATVAKVTQIPLENSPLTLIQNRRPSLSEMAQIAQRFETLSFDVDFSPLLSNITGIFDHRELPLFSFCPIENFSFSNEQKEMVQEGALPTAETFSDVILNEEMAHLLDPQQAPADLVGKTLLLKSENTIEFTLYGDTPKTVIETFSFEHTLTVAAVVSETAFLNKPRVFYSHQAAKTFFEQKPIQSTDPSISWLECLRRASGDAFLSSYHYLVFLSQSRDLDSLYRYSQQQKNGGVSYDIVSHAFVSRQAFDSIAEILNLALILFVGIALLGSLFILGLSGYASFVSHFKESAILLTLGAGAREIQSVFLIESLIVGTFSSALGILLSLPLQALFNGMVVDSLGISSPIRIPFYDFLGIPFLLVFLVFVVSMGLSLLSTWLPIAFFKQEKLATYLRDE